MIKLNPICSMLYGSWIRAARVPVGSSSQRHEEKISVSPPRASHVGNEWVTPIKVATRAIPKNIADATPMEIISRGSRFIPLTSEHDWSSVEVCPMEGMQAGCSDLMQAKSGKVKDKRKRSLVQSHPNERSTSVSPPQSKVIV